jgi:twinkle protein
MELPDLKKALRDRAEEVCRLLLPEGKQERNEWKGGRLANGEGGHSLSVCLTGEKAGVFTDFGGSGGGSNLLELWVQAKGVPFQQALAEAREWLAARGVKQDADLRSFKKKTYSKPSLAGITYIASAADAYLTIERQIPKPIVDMYKVAMTEDGKAIVFPYLNESTGLAEMVKFLKLERDENGKKVTWTSKDTPKVLFGKHTVRPDDRALLITEGEPDAMSWRSMDIPGLCCTSVPFGAKWESEKTGQDPNSEWIENDWEFIQRFERIYLSMDMDEEGRKAQASLVKRLGREICYCVELAEKDANALLQAGREDELLAAYAAAKTLDPVVLKNAGFYRDTVLDRMYNGDPAARRGIPLPFGNHPFHLRWNEWTAITGQNGAGKSQVLGFLTVYLRKLGYVSTVASMEVPVVQTLEFYIAQATGKQLPPRSEAEAALDWLAGGLWFFDFVGEASLDEMLAAFRYAYRRYGCRFFIIDSWMKLKGIKSDDYEAQGLACNMFSDFVRDCDVHLFVVAHPRKLKNEIERVGKMDVKGSGELTDQAHNVIVTSRNKAKEANIEKQIKFHEDEAKITATKRKTPDAWLSVVKQKNDLGDEPTIDLWFLKECKQFFPYYRETGVSMLEAAPLPEAPPPEPVEIGASVPF